MIVYHFIINSLIAKEISFLVSIKIQTNKQMAKQQLLIQKELRWKRKRKYKENQKILVLEGKLTYDNLLSRQIAPITY